MAKPEIRYDRLIEEALRGVVRRVLRQTVALGRPPGDHHFFISFKTGAPGVEMDKALRDQYPDDITIVLQHQFWDLKAEAEHFEVTLSFGEVPRKLVVPYAAIVSFADPSAQFGLQFQHDVGAEPEAGELATLGLTGPRAKPALPAPAKHEPAKSGATTNPDDDPNGPNTDGPDKVVVLDRFRRK